MITLDFKSCTKSDFIKVFKKLATNKLDKVHIINIYPAYLDETFNMKAFDFNAFDFWGHITFEGKKLPICGDMWYGNIDIYWTKEYRAENYMFGDCDDGDDSESYYDEEDEIVEETVEEATDVVEETPIQEFYNMIKSDKSVAELDEDYKNNPEMKKYYFWHDNSDHCKYTLVYSDNEYYARRAMIKLWGSFQDICTSAEELENKRQSYEGRYSFMLDRVEHSGETYIVTEIK